MVLTRTWLSLRAGRGLVSSVNVALGPESSGRSVGLFVRIHWRVCAGNDMGGDAGFRCCESFWRRSIAIRGLLRKRRLK